MLELGKTDWTCGICSAVGEQIFVLARTKLPPGPPDLDARVHDDKVQGTIAYDVWRCPECGFAEAPVIDLQEREPASTAVATLVRSAAYRAQLADSALPELASSYLCRAMVEAADGKLARAGWSALEGAWLCDDEEHEGAARCRRRALELFSEAEEAGEVIVEQGLPATQLLLADLHRRVGELERARACCHRGLSGRPEEPFRSLLEFELELISAEDTAAHSVSEVVGPR